MGEIAEKIARHLKSGRISATMQKMVANIRKDNPKASFEDIADIISEMVTDVKTNRSAKGGEMHKAFAYSTQAAEGGNRTGIGDEPIWQKVIDPDTKLNSVFGAVAVDEIAHLVALDQWKDVDGVIKGHIDHNVENIEDLYIKDAKYELNEGLSLLMKPANKKIYEGLKKGEIKPSIEIDFYEDNYDGSERVVKFYKPTGLGLMVEGQAMGETVGPHTPDMANAIGGKGMTDAYPSVEEKVKVFFEDVEKNKETILDKKDEYQGKLKELFGDKEVPKEYLDKFEVFFKKEEDNSDDNTDDEKYKKLVKELEEMRTKTKLFEETNAKKDELLKQSQETAKKMDELLIAQAIKSSPYSDKLVLVRNNMTYEEVVKQIEYLHELDKYRREGMPDKDVPPMFPGERPVKDRDAKGNFTQDAYKVREKELLHGTPKKSGTDSVWSKL